VILNERLVPSIIGSKRLKALELPAKFFQMKGLGALYSDFRAGLCKSSSEKRMGGSRPAVIPAGIPWNRPSFFEGELHN
jgi:hypothetical protein